MFYEEIFVGQEARIYKTISERDVVMFATVSGDKNPLHLDVEFAARSRYGKRIIPGMLVGSYFSTIFATDLPGPGCIYVSQNLEFIAPVFLGDSIEISVTVIEKMQKGRIRFKCIAKNCKGEIVVNGEGICLPPKCIDRSN